MNESRDRYFERTLTLTYHDRYELLQSLKMRKEYFERQKEVFCGHDDVIENINCILQRVEDLERRMK